MSAAGGEHQHDDQGRGFDWFALLDILVWASIVVLVALAAEWAYGAVMRERISRGASRYLAKAAAEPTPE